MMVKRSTTRRPRWKSATHVKTVTIFKTSTATQTELLDNRPQKKKLENLKSFESVNRIISLPIVESGWNYAENLYSQIKQSNHLVYWTLQQAEFSLQVAVDTALPVVNVFEKPITAVDRLLCRSLDIVEKNMPSIALPPEMMYWNTKQYVTDVSSKIVQPVLKRADSVKQMGNSFLASKYTAFAADTLDGALDVADKYVEMYLPASVYDDQNVDEDNNQYADHSAGKALQTVHHVGRFSGKLKRRLTKITLQEAKALKEHSAEAIHVLAYVAELILTDPKLAFEEGKKLWANLSKDEPENQARPENLEQLVVLLTRESARRMVHFINFTSGLISKIPKNVSVSTINALNKIIDLTNAMVKSFHLEGVQHVIVSNLKYRAHHFTLLLKEMNGYVSDVLEKTAQSLNTPEQPKTALEVPKIKVQLRAVHRARNSNGYDSPS